MGDLRKKVAIITGAGSGLGKEAAIAFAKAGANLVICGRHFDKIEQVEELIRSQYNVDVLAIRADCASEIYVKNLVKAAIEKYGRIDILVNNAAVFQQYKISDCSLGSWEYQIHNNTTSVFLMTRECLPIMRTQKDGHIINITSGLVREGAAGFGPYAASKAAVEALSFSIEEEEHKNGIKVHVFNPGALKTRINSLGEDPAKVAPCLVHIAQMDSLEDKRVIQFGDFQVQKS